MKKILIPLLLTFLTPVHGEIESRKVNLTNVDYRSRMILSVKVPDVGKLRIRGSIERRYRVRPLSPLKKAPI